jgi:hypothetical protein
VIFTRKTTFVATLLIASAALATDANAADERGGCNTMAQQVYKALEANPQSANLDAARSEQKEALLDCSSGYYGRGVLHYSRALELLGVAKQ